jgi:hypothetical protein
LEDVVENRRKKKRVVSAADLKANKKARTEDSASKKGIGNKKGKGNTVPEAEVKNEKIETKADLHEKDEDGKIKQPHFTKIRKSIFYFRSLCLR